MKVDNDRQTRRTNQIDAIDQNAVDAVAAFTLKLQERPGIDGKAYEFKAGAAQRPQFGDKLRVARVCEWREDELPCRARRDGRPRHHMRHADAASECRYGVRGPCGRNET